MHQLSFVADSMFLSEAEYSLKFHINCIIFVEGLYSVIFSQSLICIASFTIEIFQAGLQYFRLVYFI